MPTLTELGSPPPPPGPADWNDDGVVLLPGFFDDALLAPYRDEWRAAAGFRGLREVDGVPVVDADTLIPWPYAAPYMHQPALRRLLCDGDLGRILTGLTGDRMALSLALTEWKSTERDWHADAYLNEPDVGDWYAAVWIALDDVPPDSGVFEYVPGSHRWPQVTRETIARYVDLDDPLWPRHSEAVLTPCFEAEIEAREATTLRHLPRRGDVLIWHARLLHRGTRPKVPDAYRPSLIAHYSGANHRPLLGAPVQEPAAGGWYFPVPTP